MFAQLTEALFTLSIVVLFIVPAVFMWNDVYEDGVIGRGGLCGICGFAFLIGLQMLNGTRFGLLPETAWLVISFAVFLVWHLFRFHARVLKQRKSGQRWPVAVE